MTIKKFALSFALILCTWGALWGQTVDIKGFSSASAGYDQEKLSFGFAEQDFLINASLTNNLSFLGETVARFDHHSEGTKFSVEVERVIMKYNFHGNHNIIFGKVHNPINYWNDIYHHGEIFYPTVQRPKSFSENVIPIHSTGIGVNGHDLGKLKFGYDIFVGNGLGSEEIKDNDKYKSLTVAAHIKPANGLRIGASYYYDIASKGAFIHNHYNDQEIHEDRQVQYKTIQHVFSGHIAYFGKKFELLGESSLVNNHNDSTCYTYTTGSYLYAGFRITKKIIPYIRVDHVHFQDGEIFFVKNNTSAFVGGIRYEINYLAKLKFEYEYEESEIFSSRNKVIAQITIGF